MLAEMQESAKENSLETIIDRQKRSGRESVWRRESREKQTKDGGDGDNDPCLATSRFAPTSTGRRVSSPRPPSASVSPLTSESSSESEKRIHRRIMGTLRGRLRQARKQITWCAFPVARRKRGSKMTEDDCGSVYESACGDSVSRQFVNDEKVLEEEDE